MATSHIGRLTRDQAMMEIRDEAMKLAEGSARESPENYHWTCGYVAGMKRVLEIIDEKEGE